MVEQSATQPLTVRRAGPVSVIGLVVALLALAGAALSPWVVDALKPKPKPLDEVAADVAGRIKDRLAAKAKGQQYVPPVEPERVDWSKRYTGGVVGAGVLAICIGVVGLVRRGDRRLNSATVAVGASAVVFQYALLIAALLLLILLVGLVLAAFGDGL